MPPYRRPRWTRHDANQAEVFADLRKMGVIVWDTSDQVGMLDGVCFWHGHCVPIEVKRPGHETELTSNEVETILALRATGVEAVVATCAEDVVAAFEMLGREEGG